VANQLRLFFADTVIEEVIGGQSFRAVEPKRRSVPLITAASGDQRYLSTAGVSLIGVCVGGGNAEFLDCL
jgi:hypothetical protein